MLVLPSACEAWYNFLSFGGVFELPPPIPGNPRGFSAPYGLRDSSLTYLPRDVR